jgi:predicted nucleic acid-binding protein
MKTYLIDTPLLKMPPSPGPTALRKWCEDNTPSLFLSAASLAEIIGGVSKSSASQSLRARALREWIDGIAIAFADRILGVDVAISKRAGELLPHLANAHPRHRLHDAILVATAQAHGHGLVTRREGIFGPWTQTPIEVI